MHFNALPNNTILNKSKLKHLQTTKRNFVWNMKQFWKRENADQQHFLLSLYCFQNAASQVR